MGVMGFLRSLRINGHDGKKVYRKVNCQGHESICPNKKIDRTYAWICNNEGEVLLNSETMPLGENSPSAASQKTMTQTSLPRCRFLSSWCAYSDNERKQE
jgi:hypothetical protein